MNEDQKKPFYAHLGPTQSKQSEHFRNMEERYEKWQGYKRITPTEYKDVTVLIDRATSPKKRQSRHSKRPLEQNDDAKDGNVNAIPIIKKKISSKSPKPSKKKTPDKKKKKKKEEKKKLKEKGKKDKKKEKLKKPKPVTGKKIDFQTTKKSNFWVTSDLYRNLDHESYVIAGLRDFIIFIFFLIIISIITFGVMDTAYNYYAHVISEIFTKTKFDSTLGIQRNFKEIATIPQIWEYLEQVFVKIIYDNNYDELRSTEFVKPDSVLVLYNNILVGTPRIRQVRVRNDTCKIALIFLDLFSTCYDYYSVKNEETTPLGKGNAFSWMYKENEDNPFFTGLVSSYGPGGYSFDIDRDSRYTGNLINELEYHNWISLGTRAVFIEFTTYTPNTNLFCVAKLALEFPPTGGILTSSYFYTMKFLRYVDNWDYFVFACEILAILFIIFYTIEELIEITKMKMSYFKNFWNYLDLSILIVAYITIITGAIRFSMVEKKIDSKIDNINSNTHAVFDDLVQIQVLFNSMMAILCFLTWIKFLKFAALIRTVALILTIFIKVWWELVTLSFMLLSLVVAFSLFGHLLFGTTVENFDSIKNSMFTLIGMFVGGMYFYEDCEHTKPILAPIFFSLYIFIVIILFLNCFIALIVHGFYLAHEEFEDQRNRVYITDIFYRFGYSFFRMIRKYRLAEKIRQYDLKKRNKKDYNSLLDILRRHGFRGLELALILKKYNLVPGEQVTFETMDTIYKDINIKNQLYLEVEEHDKITEQTERINQKIEFLENTLADMMTKVDILVDKLLYQEMKKEHALK